MKPTLAILLTKKVVGITAFVILSAAAYFWIRSATTVRHLTDNLIAAYLIGWGIYAFLSNIPRMEFVKRFVLTSATIGCVLALRVYHGLENLNAVSEEVQKWTVNDLPERLRTIVADSSPDIGYVDLTSTFKSEVARGTSVFLSDDTHWSSDGNRIVAKTIHNLLSSRMTAAQ